MQAAIVSMRSTALLCARVIVTGATNGAEIACRWKLTLKLIVPGLRREGLNLALKTPPASVSLQETRPLVVVVQVANA